MANEKKWMDPRAKEQKKNIGFGVVGDMCMQKSPRGMQVVVGGLVPFSLSFLLSPAVLFSVSRFRRDIQV